MLLDPETTPMRTHVLVIPLTIVLLLSSACTSQQTQPAPQKPGSGAQIHANLRQLMRGILYPNSNVVFAAQSTNPADMKPADDSRTPVRERPPRAAAECGLGELCSGIAGRGNDGVQGSAVEKPRSDPRGRRRPNHGVLELSRQIPREA